MNIVEKKMFCPKCKREYINRSLVGFSEKDKEEVGIFLQNNKEITHCTECGIQLLEIFYKNDFDDNGNYAPVKKTYDKNYGIYNVYLELLNSIKLFFKNVNDGKVSLYLEVHKENDIVYYSLLLIGNDKDRNTELLSALIEKYVVEYGDRKNKFMIHVLYNSVKSIVSSIYNYIFVDELSGFKESDKARIVIVLNDNERNII